MILYEGIIIQDENATDPSAVFRSDPYNLIDVINCTVTEERNGQFSLVMTYPIGAQFWEKILPDAVIMAQPRPEAGVEPFQIYEIEQVIDGIITARANHLVYALDGVSIAMPNNAFSGLQGITAVLNELEASGRFSIRCFGLANDGITDTTTEVDFGNEKYCSVWKAIGIICNAFNAEMKYTWNSTTNRCTITFCAARGTAKQTQIAYGVNIIALDRKLDYSQMYSHVVTLWVNPDPNGSPAYRTGHANTGYTARVRSLWIDVSNDYQTAPSTAQLDSAAQAYVNSHDFSPLSDLTVDFVPLNNTTDYSPIADEVLDLCDTATVDASLIGVTATAECVKTVYNPLTFKYDSVTVGTIQDTIVDTIIGIDKNQAPAYDGSVS